MVVLPLDKRLKKRLHRSIALAQDILVMEVYNSFPQAVIHGGTALWRCYRSNRFSEDVDLYLPVDARRESFRSLLDGLEGKGFLVEKFKKTGNSVFSKYSYLEVAVRLEAVFKKVEAPVLKRFEMVDGTFILVKTLKPEEMLEEKIRAYFERRKVRDLYDVFFLTRIVGKGRVRDSVVKLVEKFKTPVDEKELKTLIISGSIPEAEEMLESV
ncbi:MAG: nucleotidyl transferase AbiEii/AbiGii toxin family protein, partial [Thermoproteota archaeon]